MGTSGNDSFAFIAGRAGGTAGASRGLRARWEGEPEVGGSCWAAGAGQGWTGGGFGPGCTGRGAGGRLGAVGLVGRGRESWAGPVGQGGRGWTGQIRVEQVERSCVGGAEIAAGWGG